MLEWIETPKRAHLVLEIANMGNLAEYIKRVCSSSHIVCLAPHLHAHFSSLVLDYVCRTAQHRHIWKISKPVSW